MKRFLLGGALLLLVAFSARAGLQEGDVAPDFNTQASFAGKPFAYSLKEARGKGPVVVADGKIVASVGDLQPAENVEKALEIVQGLVKSAQAG